MQATERLLVVDDEEIIRIRRGRCTQESRIRRLQTATCAEHALRLCETSVFDLALIDLKMPGTMDGLGLLGELRRRWPKIILIVMTGYGTMESAIAALRQGAHDYLAKPASVAQIVESVRSGLAKRHRRDAPAAVDRGPGRHAAPAQAGRGGNAARAGPDAIRVDDRPPHARGTARRCPTGADRLPRFDLLDYLAQHSSRVVMASELAKAILGYDPGRSGRAPDRARAHSAAAPKTGRRPDPPAIYPKCAGAGIPVRGVKDKSKGKR